MLNCVWVRIPVPVKELNMQEDTSRDCVMLLQDGKTVQTINKVERVTVFDKMTKIRYRPDDKIFGLSTNLPFIYFEGEVVDAK